MGAGQPALGTRGGTRQTDHAPRGPLGGGDGARAGARRRRRRRRARGVGGRAVARRVVRGGGALVAERGQVGQRGGGGERGGAGGAGEGGRRREGGRDGRRDLVDEAHLALACAARQQLEPVGLAGNVHKGGRGGGPAEGPVSLGMGEMGLGPARPAVPPRRPSRRRRPAPPASALAATNAPAAAAPAAPPVPPAAPRPVATPVAAGATALARRASPRLRP